MVLWDMNISVVMLHCKGLQEKGGIRVHGVDGWEDVYILVEILRYELMEQV